MTPHSFKPSGLAWAGDIPAHWTVAPLYTRYGVQLGKMLDEKRITGRHLAPYLRNVDVQWDWVVVSDLPEMDFDPDDRARFSLREGDLLVCEGGEAGRTALWRGELAECYYQKAIHRLRPRSTNDHPRHFYYLMNAMVKRGVFVAGGNPNTIDHLTAEKLRRHRFPFPPQLEQQAIVTFLDRKTAEIDAVLAAKGRMIGLLQEKRQALISRAVTRGLDPSAPMKDTGIEWLGTVPAHWGLKPLGYLVTLVGGATPSKDNCDFWDGAVPWVSPKDMKTWEIDDSEDHITEGAIQNTSLTLVPPPAVLLVVRGMILSHTVPVALTTVPVTINQDMKVLVPKRGCSARFLAHLLRAVSAAFLAIVEESGHGTKCLRTELWKKLLLPLPPALEQEEIVAHIDRETACVDRLITLNTEQIAKLREYRQALITAAVTGQIDVTREAL